MLTMEIALPSQWHAAVILHFWFFHNKKCFSWSLVSLFSGKLVQLSPNVKLKAKLHQIRFRLGSAPDSAERAYSTPPDCLAGYKGHTSYGLGYGMGKEEGKGIPTCHFSVLACMHVCFVFV